MKFVRHKLSKCQKVRVFFTGIVGLTDIVYAILGFISLGRRGLTVLGQEGLSERFMFFGISVVIANMIIFGVVPFISYLCKHFRKNNNYSNNH